MKCTDNKELCDTAIDRGVRMLVDEMGVPIDVLFERILIFAVVCAVSRQGVTAAAAAFRALADQIEVAWSAPSPGEGLH